MANFQPPACSRAFDYALLGKIPQPDGWAASNTSGRNAKPLPSSRPLAPSYLKGTPYLQRLLGAHKSASPGSAEDDSHVGINQMTGILAIDPPGGRYSQPQRAPATQMNGKTSTSSDPKSGVPPLPSRWNADDRHSSLEILADGKGVEIISTGLNQATEREYEACAIRANHPMPAQAGLYYFEIMILGYKRDDTTIAIGFASKKTALTRAPGWEEESWGYHSDDGNLFTAQATGTPYGPKFGLGDTIGCGVNFKTGTAFYTKNGHVLGQAFNQIPLSKKHYYPIIGLKKSGDHIWANFGQVAFQYDIDGHMKREQDTVLQEMQSVDTSELAPPLDKSDLIQKLVLDFLHHDSYVETAKAFAEEILAEKRALSLDPKDRIQNVKIRDDEDAQRRQTIRQAMLDGDMDRAMEYTKAYYPSVLETHQQVYFRLRCRKYVEMIRKEAEMGRLLAKTPAAIKTKSIARPSFHAPPHRLDDGDVDMDSNDDDEKQGQAGMDEGVDLVPSGLTPAKYLEEVIEYGRTLTTDFSPGYSPEFVKDATKELDEIVSLIAYPNPLEGPAVSHLFEKSQRLAVAEELNSAILASQGKSSRSALETMHAQTSVVLEDLTLVGQTDGPGSLLSIQHVINKVIGTSIESLP